MASRHAFVAATRFGLGARPGDLAAIDAVGPKTWVLKQLDIAPQDPRLASLSSTRDAVDAFDQARKSDADVKSMMREALRDRFASEQAAHLVTAAASEFPVYERLVSFWANHFTVSIARREVLPIAGAFERDAIRAKMRGTFSEMLVASTRHPAMLAYLDNARSIGPGSPAGTRSGRGLNENLAREVLELHTLGVDGGYTQADVENLAKILTGWGVDTGHNAMRMDHAPSPNAFRFNPRRHEPGPKTLLDVRYPGGGEADGLAALRKLGRHEATAHHIATKLVRHFVADDPPAAAVRSVAKAFRDSSGHLPTVHRAVAELSVAWSSGLTKVKTPRELVVSTARALSYETQGSPMLAACRFLGQLPYEAPSPQGWPDRAEDWLAPEALLTRLDWIEQVGKAAGPLDGLAIADQVIGPVMSAKTRAAIAKAQRPMTIALLLASPEFQRR
ncbi:MAG: DUF1800 domain-containing protein [Myxococcota bacterium]